MRTVFGAHEDRTPALAQIMSYVRVWGAESAAVSPCAFFTHLHVLGEARLQLYVLGLPWTHQTRPFVQVSAHSQRVVSVEEGASWLT